jgi:hypothetical protein
MNDSIFSAASHALYGQLAGMPRSAWRRSAQQAGLDERGSTERPHRPRHGFAVGATLVAATLLAVGAVTMVVPLTLASTSAIAAAPARPQAWQVTDSPQTQRHAQAVQAFRAQRYADAYGRFARLADEGYAPSALMALVMVCHGPSLFGSEWSATPGQLQRWSAMALHDVHERAVWIAEHDRGE